MVPRKRVSKGMRLNSAAAPATVFGELILDKATGGASCASGKAGIEQGPESQETCLNVFFNLGRGAPMGVEHA